MRPLCSTLQKEHDEKHKLLQASFFFGTENVLNSLYLDEAIELAVWFGLCIKVSNKMVIFHQHFKISHI
jgi:hypothetical protein